MTTVSHDAAPPPPHAPESGRVRRLLGSFHVTGAFWYRIHRWGVSILPEWGVWLSIALFTTFFSVVLRRIRQAAASNLEAVLGPCGRWRRQRRIYRTLWQFAWCLSERYERLSLDRRGVLTVDGDEVWQQVQAGEEGFILVTAHVGHWEVGSLLVPQRHVHVVREPEMDPKAQAIIRELVARQEQSGFTTHFAADDPSLGPLLLGALRRGEIVALQGDRPRATGRLADVRLFGRPLSLPAGPAALARAAGVALVPVFVFRQGRHSSRIVFRPPIRVTERGHQGLVEAMRRIAAEVEWAIRQEPYQWFCFRELWPRNGGSRG